MFSYEYCEIFKNTYFEEHLRATDSTAASEIISMNNPKAYQGLPQTSKKNSLQ